MFLKKAFPSSPKVQVAARLEARDLRSFVGSNLALIRKESDGLDPWTAGPGQLKKALLQNKVVPVPVRDPWRVHFHQRLLEERLQPFYTGEKLQEKRVQGLLDSLVVN